MVFEHEMPIIEILEEYFTNLSDEMLYKIALEGSNHETLSKIVPN